MGEIHMIRTFLPKVLSGGKPGHVVSVSSMAGLIVPTMITPYVGSKFGLVGVTQSLRQELALVGEQIGASVVCPGAIRSKMVENEKKLYDDKLPEPGKKWLEDTAKEVAAGMDPEQAGDIILDAVEADHFWILPNAEKYVELYKNMVNEVGFNPRLFCQYV